MHGRFRIGLLLATLGLLAVGCAEKPPTGLVDSDTPSPPPKPGRLYDAHRTGTVRGEVVWAGDPPQVSDLWVRALASDPNGLGRFRSNPHAPVIDSQTKGVGGTFVYLNGVDPERAGAWPHEPVRVVLRDFEIQVEQGLRMGRTGLVRRGDAIEMVSADKAFHSLGANGAAFFTLPFPDPDQPARRRLTEPGVVELSSGAGWFWMKAQLFVADHPYFTITDPQGRFTLPDVPDGSYELICWMPNFHVKGQDRDPETGRISRLTFAQPVALVQTVVVEAGQATLASFALSEKEFAP